MALQKGTVNGQPCVVDSAATSTPILNVSGDGGDIIAAAAGWIAGVRLIIDATEEAFTTVLKNKLDAIEAEADVTDATNVAAAGAVMLTTTTTASMQFVVDEDNMASNSATKVPTQQSTKAYVDTVAAAVAATVPADADDVDETATRLWLAPADQTKLDDLSAAIDSEIGDDTWQDGSLNRIGTIYLKPSGQKFVPSADTDAARGTALAAAMTAFAAGSDREMIGSRSHVCEVSAAITVTLGGERVIKGINVKAALATDFNYLCKITASSGADIQLIDTEFNHNGTNVARVSGIGDTLYLSGAGDISLLDSVVKDGPTKVASPLTDGALLRVDGGGKRIVERTKVIDPAYSCLRIHSVTSEWNDVTLDIRNYKAGTKARFLYCDSQAATTNIQSIQFRRGVWRAKGAFERNANFDSWNGDVETTYYRIRWISIVDTKWEFGEGEHTNSSGDSFLKFDDVDDWEVVNVTETHTVTGTVGTSSNMNESVITVGKCRSGKVINCRFDGYIKGAGDDPSPHRDTAPTDKTQFFCHHLLIENTALGVNANISHAVGNAVWFDHLEIVNPDWRYVVGGGSGGLRCCIQNVNGDSTPATRRSGQKITIRGSNCNIETLWEDNLGAIVRVVENVGLFACDDLKVTDNGTYGTIMSFSNASRLMASARPAEPTRLFFGRNPIMGGDILLAASDTVYSSVIKIPVTPEYEGQDCFPSLTTGVIDTDSNPSSAIIENIDRGEGGNGYAESWILNSSGVFVESRAL